MARLPLVDPDDPNADEAARTQLLRARAANEKNPDLPWRDINVVQALANHPRLLEGFTVLSACSPTPATASRPGSASSPGWAPRR